MRTFMLLVAALWFGGGAALMFFAAPSAFQASPDRATAANVVAAILMRWHYLALVAPVLLLINEWVRGFTSNGRLIVLVGAIILAIAQTAVDLKIRAIRASSPVPISSLDRSDPVRKKFGALHGASTILMLLNVVCAGVALTRMGESEGVPPLPR